MSSLDFIITTVALMILSIFYTLYLTNYISTNVINTVNYASSLIATALTHEFRNAVSLVSMSAVTGSFTYNITLPTSTVPVQGVALTYTVTLYTARSSVPTLMANITATMAMGPVSRSSSITVTIYSSTQPYTIIAYGCANVPNGTVVLISPTTLSRHVCTWGSSTVRLGNAAIKMSKPT